MTPLLGWLLTSSVPAIDVESSCPWASK
jgi:hypothetical protein